MEHCCDGNTGRIPATEVFLGLAEERHREACRRALDSSAGDADWAVLQQRFLEMIDAYLEKEMEKPVEANIGMHEAGGQWRIAFPHQAVRGNPRISYTMKKHMEVRRQWAKENLYHGFPDCCEVHHEIETFIYFQMPLAYWKLPGTDIALESLEDLVHHIGNWEPGAPAWYDWKNNLFTSCWIGTKEVRNYPPYDYQEANHFRFIDAALAAYLMTGGKRYMDLVSSYADMWCNHIEKLAAAAKPISCSIVPEGAEVVEMGYSGTHKDAGKQYMVFYTEVSDNTVYDVVGTMLDLFRVTRNERYLKAVHLMMDQLFDNGAGGRPAIRFSKGCWEINGPVEGKELSDVHTFVSECTLLARLAVRHDMITGTDRYRSRILAWAAQIDENANYCDQMMANLLVAAHFYDGNPQWLRRAYAMALRTAAVAEGNDEFHQCNWVKSRQGTKFLMELLYQPLLGGVEWGTSGNIPVMCFKHFREQGEGLPAEVSFRTWRIDNETLGFEAINRSTAPTAWFIRGIDEGISSICILADNGEHVKDNKLQIDGRATITGRIALPSGNFVLTGG